MGLHINKNYKETNRKWLQWSRFRDWLLGCILGTYETFNFGAVSVVVVVIINPRMSERLQAVPPSFN